jgi:hypothetical protein|nr:DUF4007 family protein [uncultured Lachnoclostridium sp.]
MGNNKAIIKLKGHEKFVLREGWLNKGLQVLSTNIGENDYSRIFHDDNAPDEFGVGSNMVKSIRYWLKAFGLTEDTPGKGVRLRDYGRLILQYDPCIEDINTLWLLHSTIARNSETSTIWYLFFNKCDIDEFSKFDIEYMLDRELQIYSGGNNYAKSSLKDDIDVMLNMYCKEKTSDYDPEDKNICPLAALGLVRKVKNGYRRVQADISKLNEMIILYELNNIFNNNISLSIDQISTGENGLARIYNLNNISINTYLDKLEHMGYIRVNRTAGLDVVYLMHEMKNIEIIEEYYKTHR